MLTYYCPQCWGVLQGDESHCPHCGYELGQFTQLPYEDKLLAALHHPVQERQIIAAQVLGELGSVRALPEFEKLLEREEDYYLLRAVLLAVARIDHPQRRALLRKAREHSSLLVRSLAQELLEQIAESGGDPSPDQAG